jgi:glycosidase
MSRIARGKFAFDDGASRARARAIYSVFALGWLLGALFAAVAPAAGETRAGAIERVDPPSWWIGFVDPNVQLMVHGRGVADLEPSIDHPGVRLASVTRTANRNYLFLTLAIARTATPGRVPIVFRRANRVVATHEFPIEARRAGSREREGFDGGSAIYLLMPDRFANGDPSNDAPPGTLDRVDRRDPGARHGGDIAGLAKHLDYVAGMGFTHLWSTPLLENAQPSYSYHGYAITDHYRIDPRYGDNAQYRALSRQARDRGLGLVWDVVVNHVGDGHWWYRDPPAPDWFNDAARRPITNHAHTSVQDPYGATDDRELYARGWFDTHMPDLNQSNPLLATYLVQNVIWWVEYADLAGLRVDTYSYSNRDFMGEFSKRLATEYPRLNVVGEEWHTDPAIVAYWQRGKVNADGFVSWLPSLMDFPLQKALVDALTTSEASYAGLKTLYERIGTDYVYANPRNLVIFGDNHDFDRLYAQLGRDDGLFRMALTVIATMRGIPQVFYGTELKLANVPPRVDGEVRMDFPGGWPGDPADAFSGRGLAPDVASMQDYVRRLFAWRRTSAAVHSGTLRHYVPRDGVYVYFRHAPNESVMVVLNKSNAPVTLDLTRFHDDLPAGSVARDVIAGTDVTLGTTWIAPARSATVLDLRGAAR